MSWYSKKAGYDVAIKAIRYFWPKRHESARARQAIRRAVAQARRCR